MPLQPVLDALAASGGQPKRNRSGWVARCPAHEDKKASLSIRVGDDGRSLLHCFAGCSTEAVLSALGLSMSDLFPTKPANGKHRRPTVGASTKPNGKKGERRSVTPPVTAQHRNARGCTLADYAAAKGLRPEFLSSLGVSEISYFGAPAVRISYRDEGGAEVAVRFRVALEGEERFRWRRGDKPCPYGLPRLAEARANGRVIIVEGESDAQTLWCHGEPAVGIPGAASWRPDWDRYIDGIPEVYITVEADRGGEAVLGWLERSPIRARAKLVRLDSFKDPSALHVHDPKTFLQSWRKALDSSVPWADLALEKQRQRESTAWSACRDLASQPDILGHFASELGRRGVAGEGNNAKVLYLALTSRLLDRPVSIGIKGPSSVGKSHLVDAVLRFFPEGAAHALSAMSERALAYSEEPLAHRFLVVYEWAGLSNEVASYLVRSLLSEGRVRYETVEKTKDGLRPRLIEREGPTGLLVTTTATHLHAENETRMLSLTVRDDPAQTSAVLSMQASEAEGDRQPLDVSLWHSLQNWLCTQAATVVVPFASALAKKMPPVAVRLRRDFPAILALIKAHALIHQVNRSRDAQGRVAADLRDYAVVRGLVAEVLGIVVEATVPNTVRETVRAVASVQGESSITDLARRLELDKSATSRRVRQAIERGFLRNLEEKSGRPARLVLAEAMPEDRDLLPLPEALQCCSVDGGDEQPLPTPLALPAEDPKVGTAENLRPGPRLCPVCGESKHWQSVFHRVLCACCHPPAAPELVAAWLEGAP
jgi:transposase-like protein